MMNHLVEMNMIMLEADRSLYLLAREYVNMMGNDELALNDRKVLLWEVINKTDKTISDGKDNSKLVRLSFKAFITDFKFFLLKVVEAMAKLSLVSQTLKGELDLFERVMITELEMTCAQYQVKYYQAVEHVNKQLDK